MQKLALSGLALFLLLAAAIAVLWGDPGMTSAGDLGGALPDGENVDSRPNGPLSESLAGLNGELPPPPLSEESDQDELDADAARTLIGAQEQEVAIVAPLELQVWELEEGVPAAEAEVFVLDAVDGGRMDWSAVKGPFARHFSHAAESRGRKLRSDEGGRVHLDAVSGAVLVAASKPGMFGFCWLTPRRDPEVVQSLTLTADRTVRVKVVNADGDPVMGAAVAIVAHHAPRVDRPKLEAQFSNLKVKLEVLKKSGPDAAAHTKKVTQLLKEMESKLAVVGEGRETGRGRNDAGVSAADDGQSRSETVAEVWMRRRSDVHGLVEFEHVQLVHGERLRMASKGRAKSLGKSVSKSSGKSKPEPLFYEAVLLVPSADSVRAELSLLKPPETPIPLVMPGTGRVTLRTVDRDGRPFRHPVHVALRVEGGSQDEWSESERRKGQGADTLSFKSVGLGLTLRAVCRLDDDEFCFQETLIVGPNLPGEHVEVDLVVAPAFGMLHGRLLEDSGAPLAGVAATFLLSAEAGRVEGEKLVTDREGRFHLPYEVGEGLESPYRLEIRRGTAELAEGFVMRLLSLPEAEVTDLGDLRVGSYRTIVHGEVVDDTGAPIEGASLQLQRAQPARKGFRQVFRDQEFVRVEADEDGQFELRGELENGSYRLVAKAVGHFEESIEFGSGGAGAEPLRIVLSRESRLVGTALVPEWLDIKRVRVELRVVHVPGWIAPSTRRFGQLRDVDGKTYIDFGRLRAGVYSLSFGVREFPLPFLVVPGIVLDPGQDGLHPELVDVDLRRRLFKFDLRAVDQAGLAISVSAPQLTRSKDHIGREAWVGLPMKGGRAEVLGSTAQLEIQPFCPGYEAERQILVPGRNDVVFRRVPPVDVVLPGLAALAREHGFEEPLKVTLTRLDNASVPRRLYGFDESSRRVGRWFQESLVTSGNLQSNDVARIAVSAGSGTYEVGLQLGRENTSAIDVTLGRLQLDALDGGSLQRRVLDFDLEVPRAAFRQAARPAAGARAR